MRYAQIENDKVINVIELVEGATEWEGLLLVPSNSAAIGDDYINGEIIKPIIPVIPETAEQAVIRIKSELDLIERQALMPRGAREAFIVLCEQQAQAAGLTKEQAYQVNPFYKRLIDTNNAAIALRAQL